VREKSSILFTIIEYSSMKCYCDSDSNTFSGVLYQIHQDKCKMSKKGAQVLSDMLCEYADKLLLKMSVMTASSSNQCTKIQDPEIGLVAVIVIPPPSSYQPDHRITRFNPIQIQSITIHTSRSVSASNEINLHIFIRSI